MGIIPSVLASAWQAIWSPSVLLPSAAATLGALFAFQALGADTGFFELPVATMAWLAVVVCVQFWVGLCVTATAVQFLRSDGQLRSVYWVPATDTFQVAFVSIALTMAIFAGLLFFVVPGVLYALRWSQAMLLILDGRAEWFDSAWKSELLVYGHKMDILLLWLVVGWALALLGGLGLMATDISVDLGASWIVPELITAAVSVVANAFGLVVMAAVYHELTPDWELDRTD